MDFFAPELAASSRGINLNAGRGSVQISTNCYNVAWMGDIAEGILLDEDHPLARNKTALVLGEHFVAVNAYAGRAPKLKKLGTRNVMHAADLDVIMAPGKTPFQVFGRLNKPANFVLLHLDFGVPQNVRPHRTFWAGFDTNAEVVAYGPTEALLKLDHDYGSVRLFYADGRVGDVHYEEFGTHKSVEFIRNQEDVLVARLNLVERKLADTEELQGDKRTRAVDRWFHELGNMLEATADMGLRKKILAEAESLSDTYTPGKGVLTRFKNILLGVGDRTIYGWLFGNHSSGTADTPNKMPVGTRKGVPTERLKKLADRRDADRKERAEKKTTGGGGQNSGKQKGKKK